MKIYEVINKHKLTTVKVLETSVIDALITVIIKNRYDDSRINHVQYRNSVKRRVKKVGGYLVAYEYGIKTD